MTSPMPSRGRMSIGQVLEELRGDFPDISISKIRYLETEGLVEPERTASGYRKFSRADVDRLRFVLGLQRDKYYPLKIIRQKLDDLDRGLQPSDGVDVLQVPRVVLADDGYPTAESLRSGGHELHLTRAEVMKAAEIGTDLMDALDTYGLVTKRGAHYDGAALVVAKIAGEFAAFGLEPRHLRVFRTTADREIGLYEQVVAPLLRHGDPSAQARAEETVRNLAALSIRLHTTLVKNGLAQRG